MERKEALDPSVPVMDNGYPVYRSRGGPRNILDLTGAVYLTDFGSARLASSTHQDWWMPDTYRAPEVLMGVPWGCQVDVRSIGRWISEVPIPEFSLENWVTALPAGEDKDKFIKFMRRILVWDSMQRGTSSDLFLDEWQMVHDYEV
ncbi:hypothetical protein LTR35_017780 [Friedmanniomyces endolithicus]|uniref:Protein kinase domain-containing protein n=1 Tax=Friedmanniomyces endolithicus TaxID=329885 RepID=A0AAN6J0N5_9PEZI|nr:hypothetical protein LTR35_017780 [Friedmanniomyces endolithicus]KAK0268279.1 hypothetical protein LTS00_017611 [Friedmanniomyces endolithicus]KAK0303431.1 hypothetical protein LTR82_017554 [Friedmanniomyces endolithicus]KAK0971588.1 hypothetical protein LTR54_017764 [Friedmanniomyces endolithicus]